jgi:VanZ family protein
MNHFRYILLLFLTLITIQYVYYTDLLYCMIDPITRIAEPVNNLRTYVSHLSQFASTPSTKRKEDSEVYIQYQRFIYEANEYRRLLAQQKPHLWEEFRKKWNL